MSWLRKENSFAVPGDTRPFARRVYRALTNCLTREATMEASFISVIYDRLHIYVTPSYPASIVRFHENRCKRRRDGKRRVLDR